MPSLQRYGMDELTLREVALAAASIHTVEERMAEAACVADRFAAMVDVLPLMAAEATG